jgi:hypothetical protein
VVQGDITQTQVDERWARALTDEELEQQVRAIRAYLIPLAESDPLWAGAQSNLAIVCHASIKSRRRSSDGGGRHNIRRSNQAGRQKVNESARRQPEDLPAAPDTTADPRDSRTEKVKLSGAFGLLVAGCVVGAGD